MVLVVAHQIFCLSPNSKVDRLSLDDCGCAQYINSIFQCPYHTFVLDSMQFFVFSLDINVMGT